MNGSVGWLSDVLTHQGTCQAAASGQACSQLRPGGGEGLLILDGSLGEVPHRQRSITEPLVSQRRSLSSVELDGGRFDGRNVVMTDRPFDPKLANWAELSLHGLPQGFTSLHGQCHNTGERKQQLAILIVGKQAQTSEVAIGGDDLAGILVALAGQCRLELRNDIEALLAELLDQRMP